MNERPKTEKKRALVGVRYAAVVAIAGGMGAGACFGDNGSNGGAGGDSGDDASGGSSGGKGKGGSAGTMGDGGTSAEGGDGGDRTTGGSAGRGAMAGMSGRGGGTGGMSGMPSARCGNGVEDPGEDCDDGNTLAGDDCSWNCKSGCADCHKNECPMLGMDVEMVLDSCYDDETLAMGGPAEGLATRGELCRALVACVHETKCGQTEDGQVALDACYCATDFASCTSPSTFVPGPCKVEYEEASETSDAQEALTSASDVSRPSGRAFLVLNYCDSEAIGPCHEQCLGSGSGGMGGMGGLGGAATGGAGMGGRGGTGGAGGGSGGGTGGGGGAGSAGKAGSGGAGTSGSGGASSMCGDGMTTGAEECDGGGSPPYVGTETCSNDCKRVASAECFACEDAMFYCLELARGCRDWPTGAGRAACYDLAECIHDNPSCVGATVEGCYCGAADAQNCSTKPAYPSPNAPNGPCARQFEAAMETTSPATVLVNFGNESVPGSPAVQRVLCDLMFCPMECF